MSCCTFFTVDAATPTMKDFLGTRVEGKGEAREASPSYRQDGPDGCWWYSGRALVVVCLSVCSQSNVGFLWWVCYCAVLPQACQHRAYSYWETDTQISRRHLATAAAWCGERYYNSQLWVSLLVWQQWGSASKPCGCVWVCVCVRTQTLSLTLSITRCSYTTTAATTWTTTTTTAVKEELSASEHWTRQTRSSNPSSGRVGLLDICLAKPWSSFEAGRSREEPAESVNGAIMKTAGPVLLVMSGVSALEQWVVVVCVVPPTTETSLSL